MAITEEKTSSDLPIEIIEIILSKLPSKSLLRFKAVSKSWNTIISDPLFVQNYLHSSPKNIFLRTNRYTKKRFSLFKLQGRKFHHEEVLKRPHDWDRNVILCECNGVLLLSKDQYKSKEYMLWNPSTRRKMYFESPYDYKVVKRGICYDSVTDDFKVVLISGNRYAIYSCKNSSWTEKIGTQFYGFKQFSGIYVDGATYWVLGNNGNYSTAQLVYFDPKIDELKTLQNLKHLSDDYINLFITVACLNSNICLSYMKRSEDKTKVQIWIKEKGIVGESPNWRELTTLDYSDAPSWMFEPLCIVENKILIRLDGKRFVYYTPSEKTFEHFEETDHENHRFTDHFGDQLVPYRNSLYFPTRSMSRQSLFVSE